MPARASLQAKTTFAVPSLQQKDVDGDGVADFVVGTPGKDIGGPDGVNNVGIAYVFSGKTGQVIETLKDPPRGAGEAGAPVGSSLARAGGASRRGTGRIPRSRAP